MFEVNQTIRLKIERCAGWPWWSKCSPDGQTCIAHWETSKGREVRVVQVLPRGRIRITPDPAAGWGEFDFWASHFEEVPQAEQLALDLVPAGELATTQGRQVYVH